MDFCLDYLKFCSFFHILQICHFCGGAGEKSGGGAAGKARGAAVGNHSDGAAADLSRFGLKISE